MAASQAFDMHVNASLQLESSEIRVIITVKKNSVGAIVHIQFVKSRQPTLVCTGGNWH